MAAAAPDAWPCWAYSNHDTVRHITRWDLSDAAAKTYATLLMCLRGSVCLYQGEELGLPEAELAFEDLQDPYGIEFWPEFKGRDGCRTPMVWVTDNADGRLYHAASPGCRSRRRIWPLSVAAQDRDDHGSMLAHYRRALAFRRAHPVLAHGAMDDDRAPRAMWRVSGAEADGDAVLRLQPWRQRRRRSRCPTGTWTTIGTDLGSQAATGGSVTLAPWGVCLAKAGLRGGDDMADLVLKNVEKAYGEVKVLKDINLDIKTGRADRLRRPLGLRQIHAAADDRGAGADHRRRFQHRRRADERRAARRSAASRWCSSPTRFIRT